MIRLVLPLMLFSVACSGTRHNTSSVSGQKDSSTFEAKKPMTAADSAEMHRQILLKEMLNEKLLPSIKNDSIK